MRKLILQESPTANWHALISEAQVDSTIPLNEDQESYLVFLLMRFVERPEIASSIMALDFLNSFEAIGERRFELLRDVGDKCLLLSGLFPGRAEKRRVAVRYFVDIGRSAYACIADARQQSIAELYASLSLSFVPMQEVLLATRQDIDKSLLERLILTADSEQIRYEFDNLRNRLLKDQDIDRFH